MSVVEEGVNVVGVQFMRAGKIYDYKYEEQSLKVGDKVVVETERGPSLADVVQIKFKSKSEYKENSLKHISRLATEKDVHSVKDLQPEKVTRITRDKIQELNLDMRLLKSEVSLGGNKVVIYFSAPARVDFREMVKELASKFRARVELKQVGARDEAKILGGLGICGREFCCSTFLREFVPVSIKMAKNQNLALNPAKLSGGCGRLRCCLTYEDETYKFLKKKMPGRGAIVQYDGDLRGQVLKTDLLNQTILIEDEMGQPVERSVKDIEILEKRRPRSTDNQQRDGRGQKDNRNSRPDSRNKAKPSTPNNRPPITTNPVKDAPKKVEQDPAANKAPAPNKAPAAIKAPVANKEEWGEDIDLDELMDD